MNRTLRVAIIALISLLTGACWGAWDIPSVSFPHDSYMIPAAGGELIIPVKSTGVNDVTIKYSDMSNWEVNPDTGDMIPTQSWIKIVKVINNYQTTRKLAEWTSGIVIEIEPNNSNAERQATISVQSFDVSASTTITQPATIIK